MARYLEEYLYNSAGTYARLAETAIEDGSEIDTFASKAFLAPVKKSITPLV